MEIWNNVFMQFDRAKDGTLTTLPKPAVDTGMGLERIATVMQGVKSNYDNDLLRGIIGFVEKLAGKRYGTAEADDVSLRVIADHSRATAFLIADGVLPSNEGRGYVLRRIMRRAARHAKMLGFQEPMLFRSAGFVIETMAPAYPELLERADYVARVVRIEEERFMQTLDNGLRILNDEVEKLKRAGEKTVPGEVVFRLYDTYGFPNDLTADIVAAEGFTLDEAGFEICMDQQRQKAREHWKGSGEEAVSAIYATLREAGVQSRFSGYQNLTDYGEVLAILKDETSVKTAGPGDRVEVVTATTPFYGESGGQVGDRGELSTGAARVRIAATKRPFPNLTVHLGEVVAGTLAAGDVADLKVDAASRQATALHHTATHLLHAVLRGILGDHVRQAGSLVSPERLRFDFTHFSPLTTEELLLVEQEVNRRIRENQPVATREMETDEAIAGGATALFGEKYGERVRVVQVGEFSMELCGGTHAQAAGDIGFFKIVQETGIAAGVRRIEAVTGARALETVQVQDAAFDKLAQLLKSDRGQLAQRVVKLLDRQKELERAVETLQARLNAGRTLQLLNQVTDISGVKLLAARVDGLEGKQLRELSDQLRERLGSGVIVLGCVADGKTNLLVAVTPDLTARVQAGTLIRPLAEAVGGRGGGRSDLAQAGGSDPGQLDAALARAPELLAAQLA
jgi:alanyl-tRNA synthetase